MRRIPQQIRRSKVLDLTQRMQQLTQPHFSMFGAPSLGVLSTPPLLPQRFLGKLSLVDHFLDQHLRMLGHQRMKLRPIDQSAFKLRHQLGWWKKSSHDGGEDTG